MKLLPNLPLSDRVQVLNTLHQHHITPTQQRVEIASLLLMQYQHLSAEDILAQLNQRHPIVSKATVYNTLNLFVEKGLVKQVIVDPNKIFYDSNINKHYHFYNVDTGYLSDIEDEQVTLTHLPHLPEKTQAVEVDIVIRIRNR